MPSDEFTAAIKQKYAEYSGLVLDLRGIEWVPSAYQALQQQIQSLEAEVKEQKRVLSELEQKTAREHEDVTKLARSGTKKFLTRIAAGTKGLNEKQSKEEQEYVDAFKAERAQQSRVEILEAELAVLWKREMGLKKTQERYQAARIRLDGIYKELFEGPTNDYPEEDAKEQELKDTEKALTAAHEQLNHWSQANSWLSKADESLQRLHQTLSKAESIIRTGEKDAVSQLGKMADLKGAVKCYVEVETFVHEARKLQPTIPHLGSITVPDLSHAPKSYLRDISFHRDLLKASDQCKVAVTKLDGGLQLSRQGMDDCGQLIVQHSNTIVSLQKDLEKTRQQIMELVWKGPEFPTAPEPKVHMALRPMPSPSAEPSYPQIPVPGSPSIPRPTRKDSVEAGIMASFAALSFPDPVTWATEPGAVEAFLDASNEAGSHPSPTTMPEPTPTEVPSAAPAFPASPLRRRKPMHSGNVLRRISTSGSKSWLSSGITNIDIVIDKVTNSARLEWGEESTPLVEDMRLVPSVSEDGRFEWNVVGNSELSICFKDIQSAKRFKAAVDKTFSDLIAEAFHSPGDASEEASS